MHVKYFDKLIEIYYRMSRGGVGERSGSGGVAIHGAAAGNQGNVLRKNCFAHNMTLVVLDKRFQFQYSR